MKRIFIGVILGILAGVIDVIPMLIQKLTWDANLSAFSLWVISGFLIASSNLKFNSIIKGILISFLVLIPALIIIAWKEPTSLIPICIMTLILGSTLGFSVEKLAGQP